MKNITLSISCLRTALAISHFNHHLSHQRRFADPQSLSAGTFQTLCYSTFTIPVTMCPQSRTPSEEPATVEQGSSQVLWDGTPWGIDPAELERQQLQEAQTTAQQRQVSTVPCTVFFQGEEIVVEVQTSRAEAEYMLPIFQHLQAHLRASVGILCKYSDEDFRTPYLSPLFAADAVATPFTMELATDQIVFTHRHSAVSETLRDLSERGAHLSLESRFGLPDNGEWRMDRNSFCHSLLMPRKPMWWMSNIEELRKLHKKLLTQVEKTLQAMEERLADKEAWSAPEEKAEGDHQDVNVEWTWPVEPPVPQGDEEYGEGYGMEDEELDDEGWGNEEYEVWSTTSSSGDVTELKDMSNLTIQYQEPLYYG